MGEQELPRAVAKLQALIRYPTVSYRDTERQDTNQPLVTTLGLEKEINTFFRLHSPTVIRKLREAFPDLPENPDEKTVFLKLRELRNKW